MSFRAAPFPGQRGTVKVNTAELPDRMSLQSASLKISLEILFSISLSVAVYRSVFQTSLALIQYAQYYLNSIGNKKKLWIALKNRG